MNDERSLFEKFPNVVKIDTTFGTNNEGLPLVTLTGKTATNEIFVIARGNLPNERAFVFKWLFDEALPALFSSKVLNRVCLIISDGDSQEITQIVASVSQGGSLQNALRLQCVFHIVDRSWDSKVYSIPKPIKKEKSKNRVFEPIRKLLMHWMYSWCTSATETEEEYKFPRTLLREYMTSAVFKKRVASHYNSIIEWFRGVESTIGVSLFYKRFAVVGLEEYTNSSAKAEFSSMKHGYLKVKKSMSIARSNFHLSIQAECRTIKIAVGAAADQDHHCVWSQIPDITSNLSTYGAGLVETAFNWRFDCRSRRTVVDEFIVAPMATVDDCIYSDFSTPFVPVYRRVRTVKVATEPNGRRVLKCDCCVSERTMFCCRHQMHILRETGVIREVPGSYFGSQRRRHEPHAREDHRIRPRKFLLPRPQPKPLAPGGPGDLQETRRKESYRDGPRQEDGYETWSRKGSQEGQSGEP
jgi:hypothetical protein